METKNESRKYLCIEFHDEKGNINANLSKCPANPEMVMAALQFLTPGCDFVVSISDTPINFGEVVENEEV